jgi:hypothetical protein
LDRQFFIESRKKEDMLIRALTRKLFALIAARGA